MKSASIVAVLALVVGLSVLGGIIYILVYPAAPVTTTVTKVDVELVILGGEMGGVFGFGLEEDVIISPGPEMQVNQGDLVRLTFTNAGLTAHSFGIVSEVDSDARALFGAAVGDATRPLAPGQTGIVTFKADTAGNYFYVCTVPGHALLGMFGTFVVDGPA